MLIYFIFYIFVIFPDEYAINQAAHNVLNPKTREDHFSFVHAGEEVKLTLVDRNAK